MTVMAARASRLLRHLVMGVRQHAPLWLVEVIVLNASFALAFFVRYGSRLAHTYSLRATLLAATLVTVSYTASDLAYRSYRSIWRFATLRDLVTLALTVATAVAAIAVVELTVLSARHPIPLSALFIGGTLGYLSLSHLKLLGRLRAAYSNSRRGRPLVVVGAGATGRALVRQLQDDPGDLRPVAFIDDDPGKIGRRIGGLPVVGSRERLPAVVRRQRAAAVALAMPSASRRTVRELSSAISELGVQLLIVPRLRDQGSTRAGVALRDVQLEDLFGRSAVEVDLHRIRHRFCGRRVLVTGAAGSIGSEMARQLSQLHPALLTLVDVNESGLTDLRAELPSGLDCALRVISIVDSPAVRRVFAEARPDVVIHAAALKHVDIAEEQPHQAATVNVLGTWICSEAAVAVGASLFLFISTDKAVDPMNVLGASKRIGERTIASRSDGATAMVAVRFGNVLGSRGSVVPRFERQIDEEQPITVTHPDVQRYFMSIGEAVRLVLQSATMARSGSIYVLDMGEQVRIVELAERLARLRGRRVPDDTPIVFTGLRPGERLDERLVGKEEKLSPTRHPQINEIVRNGCVVTRDQWAEAMSHVGRAVETGDDHQLRRILLDLAVHGPEPDGVAATLGSAHWSSTVTS